MSLPEENDPLWDPQQPADAGLRHLLDVLAPYAARQRAALAAAPLPASRTRLRRRRAWLPALAVAATLLLALWGAHAWRLHWPAGQPWRLQDAHSERTLAPGARLETVAGAAQLAVARIGHLQVEPGSALRLLDSRSGRHRIELEYGRVHARIWAPPGQFGISGGSMQVIDLGCEFTLERRADGSGSLSVESGWVQQEIGELELLVPAGHALLFTADSAGTPLRNAASPALRVALAALDRGLQAPDSAAERDRLAAAVAATAEDADRYTLMSLLLREPSLANGPLYPRLARALGVRADDAGHRSAWSNGDAAAIDLWWRRLPSQPKRWWTHWRDAF